MTSQLPGFFERTGMPDPGWWEALSPDPARVLRDVGVTPGMDVVDLCSGDGWFTFPLSRIARSVIAIDIDAALLGAAKVGLANAAVRPIAGLSRPTPTTSQRLYGTRLTTCSSPTPFMSFQTRRALRKPSTTFSRLAVCLLS